MDAALQRGRAALMDTGSFDSTDHPDQDDLALAADLASGRGLTLYDAVYAAAARRVGRHP